jgi:hypothetical protein
VSLPILYYSTDASAPTLTGTAGDLVNVLTACLVNGYGAKAAAGWTRSFSGSNGAVYRQGGGNGFAVSVDDNASGAGGAAEALARGYEAPSGVGAGTGPFPTVAQLSNGIVIRKSATVSAALRTWMVAADDRTFYLFVQTGDGAGTYLAFGFGDLYSMLPGDAYRTFICGRHVANSAVLTNDNLDLISGSTIATMNGHYFARSWAGSGGSTGFFKSGDGSSLASVAATGMRGNIPFTNPTDGGIYVARVYMRDSVTAPINSLRGWMRGFWHWCHSQNAPVDGDEFTGSPGSILAGRTMHIVRGSGNSGVYCIETTNWDTSS